MRDFQFQILVIVCVTRNNPTECHINIFPV